MVAEASIQSGGCVITLTLDGSTWLSSMGDTEKEAIIAGLDSNKAEALGWDNVVKAGLTASDVARTSDTVVTITLPAFATYDITASEIVTATIPYSALNTGGETVASPTFTVTPTVVAGGGRVKKGKKKKPRYFVEVDGVLIEATSQDEATQILLQARELAKDQAPKLAEPGKNIPQIKVLTRTKQKARAGKIVDAVEEANKQIARIYRDAQKSLDASRAVTSEAAQREFQAQKRREAREKDEIDAITLILLS